MVQQEVKVALNIVKTKSSKRRIGKYKRITMNYGPGVWKLFELARVLQKPIILKYIFFSYYDNEQSLKTSRVP